MPGQTLTPDQILSLRRRADAVLTDAAFKEWEDATDAYLAAVETLPMAPENIPARIAALRVVYGDDIEAIEEWLADGDSGDCRLVRQIIMTLIRAG